MPNGGVKGGVSELELLSLLMSYEHSNHNHGVAFANDGSNCDDIGLGGDGNDVDNGVLGYASSSSSSSSSSSTPSMMHLMAKKMMRCLYDNEKEDDESGLSPESGLTRGSFRRLWLGAGCESESMAWMVGERVQWADTDWCVVVT